jgi:hypothetical protein
VEGIDRGGPKEHTVHYAEKGGVGADPERERQNHDDREAFAPEEPSNAVTQVLPKRLHYLNLIPPGVNWTRLLRRARRSEKY